MRAMFNINADTAEQHRIAGELKAESLIMMTDIKGVLRDKNAPESLIEKIYVSDAKELMNQESFRRYNS